MPMGAPSHKPLPKSAFIEAAPMPAMISLLNGSTSSPLMSLFHALFAGNIEMFSTPVSDTLHVLFAGCWGLCLSQADIITAQVRQNRICFVIRMDFGILKIIQFVVSSYSSRQSIHSHRYCLYTTAFYRSLLI